jgi:hypothetical protein
MPTSVPRGRGNVRGGDRRVVVTREGSVELEPGQAKSVVATFTDADLLVGSRSSWNKAILSESSGEWVNTVVARYVEPTPEVDRPCRAGRARHGRHHCRRQAARRRRHAAPGALAAQALRVAEIARRMGRIWGRGASSWGRASASWRTATGSTGSRTAVRRRTHTFRVEAYSIDEKWQNQLTLRQINSTVFSEGTFDPDRPRCPRPMRATGL